MHAANFAFFLRFIVIFWVLGLASVIEAILINVTVDDSLPDPLTGQRIAYSPPSAWNEGNKCATCNANLDPRRMNGGTWHDGTYFPNGTTSPPTGPLNITFRFNGTALYVFCALVDTTTTLAGFTNMTFFIDGEQVGRSIEDPQSTSGVQYNISVYQNTSLSPGTHEFVLQNGQHDGQGSKSLTLFDYLVYSYDNGLSASESTESTDDSESLSSPTTPSSPPPTRNTNKAVIIAGSVIAVLVGLSVIAILLYLLHRKRSRRIYIRPDKGKSKSSLDPSPKLPPQQPQHQPTEAQHKNVTHLNPSVLNLSQPTPAPDQEPAGYWYGFGVGRRFLFDFKQKQNSNANANNQPPSTAPSSSIALSVPSDMLRSPVTQSSFSNVGSSASGSRSAGSTRGGRGGGRRGPVVLSYQPNEKEAWDNLFR